MNQNLTVIGYWDNANIQQMLPKSLSYHKTNFNERYVAYQSKWKQIVNGVKFCYLLWIFFSVFCKLIKFPLYVIYTHMPKIFRIFLFTFSHFLFELQCRSFDISSDKARIKRNPSQTFAFSSIIFFFWDAFQEQYH